MGTTADKKWKERKLLTFVPPFPRLQTLTAEGPKSALENVVSLSYTKATQPTIFFKFTISTGVTRSTFVYSLPLKRSYWFKLKKLDFSDRTRTGIKPLRIST